MSNTQVKISQFASNMLNELGQQKIKGIYQYVVHIDIDERQKLGLTINKATKDDTENHIRIWANLKMGNSCEACYVISNY